MRSSRLILGVLAGLALAVVAFTGPALAATPGVAADLRLSPQGQLSTTNALGSALFNFNQSTLFQLSPGVAAGQADKMYAGTRTIGASSSENLDLAGVLTDPFGATLTCVKVKFIYIKAAAGNTNSVNVGGAASNTFSGPFADPTDIVSIPPGGMFFVNHPGAGWTVTPSTGDLLKVANSSSGSGVTYDIMIGCTSS